jgi:hypothetical protein
MCGSQGVGAGAAALPRRGPREASRVVRAAELECQLERLPRNDVDADHGMSRAAAPHVGRNRAPRLDAREATEASEWTSARDDTDVGPKMLGGASQTVSKIRVKCNGA